MWRCDLHECITIKRVRDRVYGVVHIRGQPEGGVYAGVGEQCSAHVVE